jgi:hypothetical protein
MGTGPLPWRFAPIVLVVALLSGCAASDEKAVSWELLTEVSPSAVHLSIEYTHRPCDRFERVEVDESAEEILLSAIVSSGHDPWMKASTARMTSDSRVNPRWP